jgi:mannose-6-phosphate isomerase
LVCYAIDLPALSSLLAPLIHIPISVAIAMTTTYRTVQVEHTDRPWGWYESIDEKSYGADSAATSNKVKRICLLPGQRLSLQKHAQRAEHWLVVRGTARVTLGQAGDTAGGSADGPTYREFDLTPGQHCDIAVGQVHRLSNLGTEPVEMIEVQMGTYLGEDDITRLQDDFGRK